MTFLPEQYEENCSTDQGTDERECRGNEIVIETSETVSLETLLHRPRWQKS